MAVKTDLSRHILPAIDKNLPFQEMSLAFILLTTSSQNCFFLGLPPTSIPKYLKGNRLVLQFKDFA